ncbi:MAG: glutamate-1-semialdehyde aminotransferase [Bacteriovoracaceae bacterium]|jgi:glutamate-1-semialdehyde aminotransferase
MSEITNFSKSNEYRKIIHDLIPGGAHTYSKGDDQFPVLSPAAIEKGDGCYVWDIDGNRYLDCSMGLTSVSLGHAYPQIIDAVKSELDKGVNFQRPSYIEKECAETFLSLIPCHDMIKFCKNGSSATTAAVKLARAYTNRKYIAFPSDLPFFSYDDWFIGSTACNKGVPEEIQKLSLTFKSQDLSTLDDLFEKHGDEIACVITEPDTTFGFPEGYLQKIRSLCDKHGSLFIADEMVSGFKAGLPGVIVNEGINPDIATWGKGIANGFSFCALTGTKEVMELGGIRAEGKEKVFLVSTTHGGETHALRAAIETIKVFKKENVIEHNHRMGAQLKEMMNKSLRQFEMDSYIEVGGKPWFIFNLFKDRENKVCMKHRTFFLQEMIKNGILFQGVFIPCFSHKEEDLKVFIEAFDKSLQSYKQALKGEISDFLIGSETKPVFRKFL